MPTNRRKFIKNIIWCEDLERKLSNNEIKHYKNMIGYIDEWLGRENCKADKVNVKEIGAPDLRDFIEIEVQYKKI